MNETVNEMDLNPQKSLKAIITLLEASVNLK